MINTSLDMVPPIRGLQSFSFPMFFIVMEDGWWCFSLEVASIFFFLEEELSSGSFREIVS